MTDAFCGKDYGRDQRKKNEVESKQSASEMAIKKENGHLKNILPSICLPMFHLFNDELLMGEQIKGMCQLLKAVSYDAQLLSFINIQVLPMLTKIR